MLMATCWHLWKQRNAYIFQDNVTAPTVPTWLLANRVCEDVHLWSKYC
jgi:hypothetical protein